MCGIAGFFAPEGLPSGDEKTNIEAMLEAITHRGPDGSGFWTDPCNTGVILGHKRLSVIDLSETGSQPMISHDRRYVITYNGEIYNTSYLMESLTADGYGDKMHGTSDTEVLLESVSRFGIVETLRKCKGMFAFALYDRQEQTLTLARDRIGEKPLYYGVSEYGFIFASELPAIRAVSGFAEDLNYDCIGDFLKYGYIPAPMSIWKDVWKLEPGCCVKIKCELNKWRKFERFSYWNITDVAIRGQADRFKGSREEAADEFERLLTDSVRGQMISDVPLGAFLSAGIDSSTIVSLMQSVSDRPVKTFTIGFEEASYNEADAAAAIAAYLGTEHTQLYATSQDALDAIPLMAGMFGEPFADSSQIPTYLVSRLTREHVTVSLSGDGGDELFAGYRDYAGVNRIYNRIKKYPHPLRRISGSVMEHIPGSGSIPYTMQAHGTLLKASSCADLYRRTYETWKGLKTLSGEAVLQGRDPGLAGRTCVYDDFSCEELKDDCIRTAMLMNMRMYHPDDILVKVDRAAMAVSLETRVPMLDRDVVEFAWTLPTEYLRDDNEGKLVLKDVLYRHVDKKLVDRPKQGFGVPVAKWVKDGKLRDWAEDLLNPDSINKHKILNANAISDMWQSYTGKGIWRPQIWYALMLCEWLEVNKI